MLAILYKDHEHAITATLQDSALDSLHWGEDTVLGLNDNYAVGVDANHLNPSLPEPIWSKVVELCSSIRSHTRVDA